MSLQGRVAAHLCHETQRHPKRLTASRTSLAACRQQFISGSGRSCSENERKSDPNGGTIKLLTDLQPSSKPGQDLISVHVRHPPLTPGDCFLSVSLQQQHQTSAGLPRYLSSYPQSCFFWESVTPGNSRGPGGAAESAQARASGQQTDDMRLHFLKNTHVTCNDGTAAGFYLKEVRGSRRWLLFLEGGWCCYSKDTCDSRYQNIPRLMSSSGWPQTKRGTGILSSQAEENPHWHNANIVFIPYCSSDVWSGTGPAPTPPPRTRQGREKVRQRNTNTTEYTFMGSLIIREVVKDLIPKGIKQAKVVMLSGTSAGGTGVLLNIERVASQLEQLGAEAQVRGLVDSGWFLESKQQRSPNCPETVSCSPEDAIKIGLRLWNGVVPDGCRQLYKRGEEWQCFFGHRLYSTLTSPLFVVQWLFDEEQLRVENIYMGGQSLSEEQWQYIQNLGLEIKNSLSDVTAVFAPSCLSHMLITKSNWMSFQVKGTSLPRALQCWDRSLEATRNNRTPAKGCPFHLVDTCQWPQCNPTCPALVDRATQQELTLLQMLVAMGLDLQKLGLDPQGDADSLASMVSNGG